MPANQEDGEDSSLALLFLCSHVIYQSAIFLASASGNSLLQQTKLTGVAITPLFYISR
jgi:hypothetical protein